MNTLIVLKKHVIILIIMLYSLTGNTQFSLKGTISGDYQGYVYLSNGIYKDSAKVENNHFYFRGSIPKPVYGWLHLKPLANAVWIYLENREMTVEGSFKITSQQGNSINIYEVEKITGSYSQNLLNEYRNFYATNKLKDNFIELWFQKLSAMISANKDQPVMGYILGDIAAYNSVFSQEQFVTLYSVLDTAAMHPYDLAKLKAGINNLNKYYVGQQFPDFELPTQQDEMITLKKYTDRLLLVDFWASWCAPCRAKHPKMINLHNKYKQTGFTILSISLDENQDAWKKAIVQDGLLWGNVVDSKNILARELGILAIPFSYLIDAHGKILAINPSNEDLERIIPEELKKSK